MVRLPKTVGTIGAGNMAEAILRGLLAAGMAPQDLMASEPVAARREEIGRQLGIRITSSNAAVAASCEVVILAVKPALIEAALADLEPHPSALFVSIAAGRSVASLRSVLGTRGRIVRAMPNTPALVRAGITAIADDTGATPDDLDRAEAILRAVGRVVRVPEAQMDAVTGLSGSGPAYVFLAIEALAEAGVREGLPSAVARELALETVLGAARLARETGEHPALLRERVTSPGGTTAAGIAALEAAGFRASILAAVRAATTRSRELERP